MPQLHLTPRKGLVTHCTGGWVGLRAGLDRCRKSHPHRIRSPDRPARRQLLYQLRYPAPFGQGVQYEIVLTDQSETIIKNHHHEPTIQLGMVMLKHS